MRVRPPRPSRLIRRAWRQGARQAAGWLPASTRHALVRRLATVDPSPPAGLTVKIAETREELEACFALLHDAYVGSGFMAPHPSGLRVTPWHALPTTTTICAVQDGRVVGTLSMVREGIFGLPLQSAFDLSAVRAQPGQLAEISALAVDRRHRRTGGSVLFPLMKFMYEYCTRYFDTRHLLIAVNPDRILLYEALLFFQRLDAPTIEQYAFAGGAPAVGATLDLHAAPERFRRTYAGRGPRRDLHHYFTRLALPELAFPARPYFTTNDPVMTPALLDHFFNHRVPVFAQLNDRQRRLLRGVYPGPAYAEVLPPVAAKPARQPLRRHLRHSIRCPGWLMLGDKRLPLNLVEISRGGARVEVGAQLLPLDAAGPLTVLLGEGLRSQVQARVVRRAGPGAWGLAVEHIDEAWAGCVQALERGLTYRELGPDPLPEARACEPVVPADAAGDPSPASSAVDAAGPLFGRSA